MNGRHPKLMRRNVMGVPGAPLMAVADPRPASPRSDVRSELADRLPSLERVQCGFSDIFVPEGLANNSNPAWYRLLVIDPRTFGTELLLNSITIDQAPCDVDGLGSGETFPCPWGDRFGRRAAIVVVRDFNEPSAKLADFGTNGAWFESPFDDPSINFATSDGWNSTNKVNPASPPGKVLFSIGFPGGKLADTIIQRRVFTKGFGALVGRIGIGHTLGVYFVVGARTLDTYGTNSDEKTIFGHVDIQLHFAPTVATDGLSEVKS